MIYAYLCTTLGLRFNHTMREKPPPKGGGFLLPEFTTQRGSGGFCLEKINPDKMLD
jgi:hypothetical protein